MRSWPIRHKLLAIPIAAVVLLMLAMLWLVASSRRYEHDVRAAVEQSLYAQRAPSANAITAPLTEHPLANGNGNHNAVRLATASTDEALDRAARNFLSDRAALAAALGAAFTVLLAVAWLTASRLDKRLRSLREMLSQVLDRGGAPGAEESQNGDEIDRLANRFHTSLFRGRERESQLRRSSEFLEFAQAAGGFGVFDLDLVTGQITGTPLFFELAGIANRNAPFTRDEWLATVHPEDFETFVQSLNAAIPEGGKFQAEYRSLQLDGRLTWLAGRGQVLMDAEGFPARAIGTVTDITERKQLEDSLRGATQSLNIAQAVAGVATMDLDFGRGRWIASDNFHDILGIPASTKLDDLDAHLSAVHPDDIDGIRRAPHETSAENPSYRREYRVVLPNGTTRWIAETASVLRGSDGEISRITGALQLITDRKLAEQAAIDAKLAAEAANRAKSTFLANLSHEIRTPMNGVVGISQMLSETALDDTQSEYVDIIRGSAQALLSLINDVLDLSKIEADRLELECVAFDIGDVIYETVAVMALQTAAKGIELVVEMVDVPFLMRGDPGRLRQIILNLLGNAIKFTHEGHIVLAASATTGEDGSAKLRIEVTDTGIGIPADRIDRLFKTFSQIDSSTTRHYGGSGLGLSIVKRLAELMGGGVGVTSEAGRGSTFWITVNLESLAEQPTRSRPGLGRKILVVDDVAASRRSLALKLGFCGFDTVTVAGVDEALQLLHGGEVVSLVLADELMPIRGGLELLAALRADSRFATLPFVLMSLFGAEHDVDGWACKPDAIGFKPIRAYKLADLLNGALTGQSPRLPANPEPPRSVPTYRGQRILLVEDNPVNQRVAQRVLQKLDADVTIANNGAEALERIAEISFDAVLMDCQMPVMDGFTAAKRIRENERLQGHGRRLPIIALTANVMTEDRENCMAAGMDAHLGKPLEPSRLAECLGRYLKQDRASVEVDIDALHELTGGDLEFERALVETFVSSGDQCLADIVAALGVSDFETIGKRAHALKGASANIHAHLLSAAASSLENAARSNATQEIHGLVRQLGERLHAVNAQLSKVS